MDVSAFHSLTLAFVAARGQWCLGSDLAHRTGHPSFMEKRSLFVNVTESQTWMPMNDWESPKGARAGFKRIYFPSRTSRNWTWPHWPQSDKSPFLFFFFFLWDVGNWTQGLAHARQVLFYWSTNPAVFKFHLETWDPPVLASWAPVISDVCLHAQLLSLPCQHHGPSRRGSWAHGDLWARGQDGLYPSSRKMSSADFPHPHHLALTVSQALWHI
jgi:hypothetical protein